MLTYEEFKEEMFKQTKEKLPSRYQDARVEFIKAPKNNDRVKEGISVTPSGKNSGATYYCVDVYADYLHNESFNKTFALYMTQLVHYLDHLPELDLEQDLKWENAKHKIVPELVSMRKNCENIGQLVYRPVEGTDMAIIYRIMQDMGSYKGSIKVTNELLEEWGVDLNRIHGCAFCNMGKILTPQVFEISPETDRGGEPAIYDKLPEQMDKESMYVFTNKEKFYGAASIMAAGVLGGIAERLQCSFYLLPMNVDDMAVIPQSEDDSVEDMQKIVLGYNICAKSEENILSDQVYFYDNHKRELSMATDPEHTQEVILKMLAESIQAGEQRGEEWER